MGTSRQEAPAAATPPACAAMISCRRAAARPRLVRRRACQLPATGNLFGNRRVNSTLSPTNRKRRSPEPGVMMGTGGSNTEMFIRKCAPHKCKKRDRLDGDGVGWPRFGSGRGFFQAEFTRRRGGGGEMRRKNPRLFGRRGKVLGMKRDALMKFLRILFPVRDKAGNSD